MPRITAASSKRLRHPYHLKRLYIHWRLRIMRHAHTGHRVHHQHTSYPLLGLILLIVGVMLAQSTVNVFAAGPNQDSVYVTAVVAGPIPTVAPTILTPQEGKNFDTNPITVSGTCLPHSYVQLFRNNYPSGTAICGATGTYSIQTSLFEGRNQLMVRNYNYEMQAGPDSKIRNVSYLLTDESIPPIQGSGGNTGGSGGTGSSGNLPNPSTPLMLKNDYLFRGFFVGEPASWQIAVLGGAAPYSISVNWGDGKTALYTSKTADTLTLTHTYAQPGTVDGSYTVTITASDANGNQTTLQVLAIVSSTVATGTSSGGTTHSSGLGDIRLFGMNVWQLVGSLWATYGALCIALLSFWLGEARELRLIRTRFRMIKL